MSKALSFLVLIALPAVVFGDPAPAVGPPPTVPTSGTAPSLSVGFSASGLSSVKWNGSELIASGAPNIGWAGFVQADGSWVSGNMNATSTFDSTNHILTQKFAWGSARYVYTYNGTQLFVDTTITNTSSQEMASFVMQLVEIKFPQTPSEYDGSDPMVGWNMGNPTIIPTTFGASRLVTTNEDVANPLMVGWPWPVDASKTTFPLYVLTGQDSMYPSSYPNINRPIPAGGTLEYKIGFRFGSATDSNYELAGDLYQTFANTFPQTLNWTDRRPIAQLMLTSYNGTYATNPNRWFGDGSVNTTTPAGVTAFQQRVIAYAQQSVANCKAENAQAAITWDMEGEYFYQPISYIGDPRLTGTLAPEMDGIADAYYKTFTDAGIKVGMTIRPQQLVLSDSNTQAAQTDVAEPGQLMIQKIGYAVNRWGASVFYVDSNGAPDDPIDPYYFREVTKAFPNILLIPEQSNTGYYGISAPYGQLDMGVTGVPAAAQWTYPQAFRVFTISDGDVTDNWDTLVNSVARGDVLFFRGWFSATENPQVTQIYQQAAVSGTN
ncbi:MAG TPA: hypothetical protein VHY22_17055 [Chthoniobacteraceae bacterium]|nr:hypothetical protein [Chthoniobacteraceae bacterium]